MSFSRILLILVTVMWKVVSSHETRITFMPCKLLLCWIQVSLKTGRLYARLAPFDSGRKTKLFNNCDPLPPPLSFPSLPPPRLRFIDEWCSTPVLA